MILHGLNTSNLVLLGAAGLIFLLSVAVLNGRAVRQERFKARIAFARGEASVSSAQKQRAPLKLLDVVQGLGELVSRSGVLSKRTLEDVRQTLAIAGLRDRGALGLLIGCKIVLLTSLPVLTWFLLRNFGFSGSMQLYVSVAAAIAGLMAPDVVTRSLRKRHLAAIEGGLADSLDLLVICSEAGLGLEAGLERVGDEIRAVHPAVATELTHCSQEMRVTADRRIALINMGNRTGVASLRRLGATLAQSMQYGTPLSDALRMLSIEMRQEALNRFEEKAGRLSVLLTMPMVVFILPCVFLVVGGPAIVQVLHVFRQ